MGSIRTAVHDFPSSGKPAVAGQAIAAANHLLILLFRSKSSQQKIEVIIKTVHERNFAGLLILAVRLLGRQPRC